MNNSPTFSDIKNRYKSCLYFYKINILLLSSEKISVGIDSHNVLTNYFYYLRWFVVKYYFED